MEIEIEIWSNIYGTALWDLSYLTTRTAPKHYQTLSRNQQHQQGLLNLTASFISSRIICTSIMGLVGNGLFVNVATELKVRKLRFGVRNWLENQVSAHLCHKALSRSNKQHQQGLLHLTVSIVHQLTNYTSITIYGFGGVMVFLLSMVQTLNALPPS